MPERTEAQEPILRYSIEIGWTRVSRDAAVSLRGGAEGAWITSIPAVSAIRSKMVPYFL